MRHRKEPNLLARSSRRTCEFHQQKALTILSSLRELISGSDHCVEITCQWPLPSLKRLIGRWEEKFVNALACVPVKIESLPWAVTLTRSGAGEALAGMAYRILPLTVAWGRLRLATPPATGLFTR